MDKLTTKLINLNATTFSNENFNIEAEKPIIDLEIESKIPLSQEIGVKVSLDLEIESKIPLSQEIGSKIALNQEIGVNAILEQDVSVTTVFPTIINKRITVTEGITAIDCEFIEEAPEPVSFSFNQIARGLEEIRSISGGSTLGELDNVDESADNIDESDTLLIKEADKDIWVSKNINDVTVSIDDFNKLLNKFNDKFPFKITSFSGGGNFKKGNTINITFRWAYDGDLDSQSFVNNGVTELLDINARSITVNNITTDSNYTLNANNVTATQYVRFYNPRYYGVINTIPTQDNFSTLGLSENISSSRGFTYSGINLNKQRICYAYPKSFGALTSVLDGSNLENLSVYTKDEFTINGELYYVYYSDIGNVSNFKQTYK